jgi:hypothetical protein
MLERARREWAARLFFCWQLIKVILFADKYHIAFEESRLI